MTSSRLAASSSWTPPTARTGTASSKRFHHGAARDADATRLRQALAPYLVKVAKGWHLRVGNATAEIYGVEELTSFMVTRVDGVALTRAEQQQHLPAEIRNDAKLVTSGAELAAFIESS